ncbi:MAG: hypothetical protein PHV45_09625, partial [Desulfuromonas thiophila]|nr:hypothetical protein [Desulfuromonas thiophila]
MKVEDASLPFIIAQHHTWPGALATCIVGRRSRALGRPGSAAVTGLPVGTQHAHELAPDVECFCCRFHALSPLLPWIRPAPPLLAILVPKIISRKHRRFSRFCPAQADL